jgi:hypothetical protein
MEAQLEAAMRDGYKQTTTVGIMLSTNEDEQDDLPSPPRMEI